MMAAMKVTILDKHTFALEAETSEDSRGRTMSNSGNKFVGKPDACLGIDVQSTLGTEDEERVLISYGSNRDMALEAESFFSSLCEDDPLFVCRGHVFDPG